MEINFWLGKILVNDIQFTKVFPATILCYTVLAHVKILFLVSLLFVAVINPYSVFKFLNILVCLLFIVDCKEVHVRTVYFLFDNYVNMCKQLFFV